MTDHPDTLMPEIPEFLRRKAKTITYPPELLPAPNEGDIGEVIVVDPVDKTATVIS